MPVDAIEVGCIVGAWGVKGGFKVQPHASDPQALFSSQTLVPAAGAGLTATAALPPLLRITQAREHGDVVVARRRRWPTAALPRHFTVRGSSSRAASFPTAGNDEYYWVDLIGLSVVNRDGVTLGQVTGLIDTGAHSVLRVRPPDAAADAAPEPAERLIPFVAAYIDAVDLAAKQIRVDWGLDY